MDDLNAAIVEWEAAYTGPDVRVSRACPTGRGVWWLDGRRLHFVRTDGDGRVYVPAASAPLACRLCLPSVLPSLYAAALDADSQESAAVHAASAIRSMVRRLEAP